MRATTATSVHRATTSAIGLLPIWNTKRETARKVRQRIGTVMKWVIAEGHRKDNPAGDAIGAALPTVGHKTTHQRAIAHGEVAEALRKVRKCNALGSTKLAFEFLVLTACRLKRSGRRPGMRSIWTQVFGWFQATARRRGASIAYHYPTAQ